MMLMTEHAQGRIQDFPLGGGANPRWRGRQPPTQALFGENICKNERIWSCWGGRTPETFVCRSATDAELQIVIFPPTYDGKIQWSTSGIEKCGRFLPFCHMTQLGHILAIHEPP